MKSLGILLSFYFWVIAVNALPLDKFVPFGLNNDDTTNQGSDLRLDLRFFGRRYNRVWINNNGAISFAERSSHPLPDCSSPRAAVITPFWSDIQTFPGDSGQVYYRKTQSFSVLETLSKEIKQANLSKGYLKLTTALVVTWFNVTFFWVNNCLSYRTSDSWPRNTFQAILTTDQNRTYAIFNYEKIHWLNGISMHESCSGLEGTPAQIGFDAGDDKNRMMLKESCTKEVLTIANKSNIGVPGKFIFRIDGHNIAMNPKRFETVRDYKANLLHLPRVFRVPDKQIERDRPNLTIDNSTRTTVKRKNEFDCVMKISSNCMTTPVSTFIGVVAILLLILMIFFCHLYQQKQISQFGIIQLKRFSGLH